jgi:hypothetical protein
MAHRLNLAAPFAGMSFIWNIDSKVGTQVTEPNNPDDVALVQLLLGIALRGGSGGSAAPGCKSPPNVTSQMDHATGYWIYFAQVEARKPADGNLSPSGKVATQDRLICRLNGLAFQAARQEWDNLPNHPQCPPLLKAKLLGPSK